MSDLSALDAALLEAHAAGDSTKLAALYTEAADQAEGKGDIEAACFYLTHAYVFALEAGLPVAGTLNRRLAGHGRDVVQADLTS